MKDPEAINRAIAEKLKERRSSIIPYVIGGFFFLNVLGALLESGSWKPFSWCCYSLDPGRCL